MQCITNTTENIATDPTSDQTNKRVRTTHFDFTDKLVRTRNRSPIEVACAKFVLIRVTSVTQIRSTVT